ncbi:hypothetical protein ACWDTI_17660 [Gordonia sp. NPDC003424]
MARAWPFIGGVVAAYLLVFCIVETLYYFWEDAPELVSVIVFILYVAFPFLIQFLNHFRAILLVEAPRIWLTAGKIDWINIESVVVTRGFDDGDVEIGVRPRPGVTVQAMMNLRGDVLTDLPLRTTVPRDMFDIDGLCWGVNLSGRHDIPIYERTDAGERLIYMSNSGTVPAAVAL